MADEPNCPACGVAWRYHDGPIKQCNKLVSVLRIVDEYRSGNLSPCAAMKQIEELTK